MCLVEIIATLQGLRTCLSPRLAIPPLGPHWLLLSPNDMEHVDLLPVTFYQTSWNFWFNKFATFTLLEKRRVWGFNHASCIISRSEIHKTLSELDHFTYPNPTIDEVYRGFPISYCKRDLLLPTTTNYEFRRVTYVMKCNPHNDTIMQEQITPFSHENLRTKEARM